LPELLTPEQLASMQKAFTARLRHVRFNNVDGYEITDGYRHMVEDVLLLDQGFVDLGLHPIVKQVLRRYLGEGFALTEAKGWKSLPTRRDFHGWHADSWYEQKTDAPVYREVKLALYLTDVASGGFNYIKGTHRRAHPRGYTNAEAGEFPIDRVVNVLASAGTAILFDTTGIHRQGVPILEQRQAIFYNYHDPHVLLQAEDVRYNRYHPLLLNAAFLGGLTPEDRQILGFGDKTQFSAGFHRQSSNPIVQRTAEIGLRVAQTLGIQLERANALFRRIFRRSR
jgi:hypothetical protein